MESLTDKENALGDRMISFTAADTFTPEKDMGLIAAVIIEDAEADRCAGYIADQSAILARIAVAKATSQEQLANCKHFFDAFNQYAWTSKIEFHSGSFQAAS